MLVTARGQAVMPAPCKGLSLLQRELAGTCVLSVLLGAQTNTNS